MHGTMCLKARNVTAYPTFDTLRGHESRPHSHDTVLGYVITLQVCTHPNMNCVSRCGLGASTSMAPVVFTNELGRSRLNKALNSFLYQRPQSATQKRRTSLGWLAATNVLAAS